MASCGGKSLKRNNLVVQRNTGFTLLEMAIVLVTIGLIVSSIMVGQELIHSGKIRKQITQIKKYNTATRAFQVKYSYLPGDLPRSKAQAWGMDNTPDFGYAGDGLIQDSNGRMPITQLWGEPYFFFIHLANAEMIDSEHHLAGGHYSFEDGEQFPKSKLAEAGIIAYTLNNQKLAYYLGNNISSIINQVHLFQLSTAGVLTPEDAFALDNKMDDGLPLSGSIRAGRATALAQPIIEDTIPNSCITTVVDNNYNMTDSLNCRLIIMAE